MMKSLVFSVVYSFLSLCCVSMAFMPDMPQNTKIAFVGDSSVTKDAEDVFRLIKNEGAEALVHAGDFDYTDSPSTWRTFLDQHLGSDFPVFFAIGNHDLPKFEGIGGYKDVLTQRMQAQGTWANCSGELGVNQVCNYNGLIIINSGADVTGSGHASFAQSELSARQHRWKVCNFHKPDPKYQIGYKTSGAGWDLYRACRTNGALIAVGHEHSYARTWPMSDFENEVIASQKGQDYDNPAVIGPGTSMLWQSGLGGRGDRICNPYRISHDWWAEYECFGTGSDYGSVFCTFNFEGNPDRAECYTKWVTGEVVDRWSLRSTNPVSVDNEDTTESVPATSYASTSNSDESESSSGSALSFSSTIPTETQSEVSSALGFTSWILFTTAALTSVLSM